MRATNESASLRQYQTALLPNTFGSVAKRIEDDLRRLVEYEVRKYKLSECLNGRNLSFEQACEEWIELHQSSFEQVLIKSLFTSA